MNIKEELRELRTISKIIDSKIRQMEQLKKYYTTVRAFDYSKEKITGGVKNDFTDTVNKIIDLEKEITKDIDELIDRKNKMNSFVRSVLSGTEYLIIQMRYFEDKRWEEIALKVNHEYRYTLKLHGKALQKLKKTLKDTQKCDTIVLWKTPKKYFLSMKKTS